MDSVSNVESKIPLVESENFVQSEKPLVQSEKPLVESENDKLEKPKKLENNIVQKVKEEILKLVYVNLLKKKLLNLYQLIWILKQRKITENYTFN